MNSIYVNTLIIIHIFPYYSVVIHRRFLTRSRAFGGVTISIRLGKITSSHDYNDGRAEVFACASPPGAVKTASKRGMRGMRSSHHIPCVVQCRVYFLYCTRHDCIASEGRVDRGTFRGSSYRRQEHRNLPISRTRRQQTIVAITTALVIHYVGGTTRNRFVRIYNDRQRNIVYTKIIY